MARQQFSGKAWTAVLAAMLAGLIPAVPAQEEGAVPCPDYTWLEDVGNVCQRPDGLLDVYTPGGVYVGPSHGADEEAPGLDIGIMSWPDPVQPECVASPASHYSRVIYARASDHADQYASKLNDVRNRVGIANAYMSDAGVATGRMTDLAVWCDAFGPSGTILVDNAVLSTSICCDSFSTIVDDLRNMGYNNPKVHYWVYYDGAMTGKCGTGTFYGDDRLSLDNLNNGNANEPSFAVLYAESGACPRTFMHELSHTMGAVQDSAPHSTGAGHCWDGHDTICYNDGGPAGGLYTTNTCPTGEPYDCGNDDYFDATPLPGTYLDTHWNIAHTLNSYIRLGRPRMDSLSCPTSMRVGRTATCTFQATDVDSGSIYYGVDWGDSQTLYTNWVTPGQSNSMSHQYVEGSAGQRVIKVFASDGGDTSPSLSAAITVAVENPPSMVLLSCPAQVYQGSAFSCSFAATEPESDPVYYRVDWGDGNVAYTDWMTPGTTTAMSKSYAALGTFTVSVTATDDGNPQKTSSAITRIVDVVENFAPVMESVTCPTSALEDTTVSCSFRATDPDSTQIYYAVNWGDGNPTVYSGWLSPGTTVTWDYTYGTPGTYTVSATATDNGNPQKTGAALTAVLAVIENGAPVMQSLSCPSQAPVGSSASCTFYGADGDSSQIFYGLNWGDGSPTSYTGWLAPGTSVTWGHTFSTSGSYTVTATATDNGNPQKTSAALTAVVSVVENLPPVVEYLTCPGTALEDTSVSCTFRATDDSSEVYYGLNWGDGTPTGYSNWLTPGAVVTWSHTYSMPGTYTITATATDNANPQKTSSPLTAMIVITVNDPPIMDLLSCPGSLRTFTCTLRAADDSGAIYYTINWGDGPNGYSGWLAPGTQVTWSHTYAADGTFSISASATDNGNPQLTSTSLTQAVIADQTPPSLTVWEPRTGFAYVGCSKVPTFPGLRAAFVESGCAIVYSQDKESGVAWVRVYFDGVLQGSSSSGGTTFFIIPASQTKTSVPLRIEVSDQAGNMAVWQDFINTVAALDGPV